MDRPNVEMLVASYEFEKLVLDLLTSLIKIRLKHVMKLRLFLSLVHATNTFITSLPVSNK